MRRIVWVAALAGCGMDAGEFVPRYADLYCDYYLSCADAALQAFDGIDSHEECLAVYGPGIEAEGEGCKLASTEAKKCLRAMELLTCPADGGDLDETLPPVCDYTWKKCIANPGGTPGDDDDDDTGAQVQTTPSEGE